MKQSARAGTARGPWRWYRCSRAVQTGTGVVWFGALTKCECFGFVAETFCSTRDQHAGREGCRRLSIGRLHTLRRVRYGSMAAVAFHRTIQ